MVDNRELKGVICALVTPFRNGRPDTDNLQRLIHAVRDDGVDGILLLGTTGEGPSLSLPERETVISAAREVSGDLLVMAGTGFPSLPDTIAATRRAFELGVDAAVILPPYYFKKVSADGLAAYFRQVLDEAVPAHGRVLLYHIPQVSGVAVSPDLLDRLVAFDDSRIAGVKDSSGDLDHCRMLCQRYPGLRIFAGTDRILLPSLQAGAAGLITAAGNVIAPLAVEVYRKFLSGQSADATQVRLAEARNLLDRYQPAAAMLKRLLELRLGGAGWEVRPPLEPAADEDREQLLEALAALELPDSPQWLPAARAR
ncbi:MAG: dihydrodipicolinate synthase family protein [Chloroflexota bacterium]|nr:MAG: dihydrodipicolinate synthase family protein [Chloroflexota bacterium]